MSEWRTNRRTRKVFPRRRLPPSFESKMLTEKGVTELKGDAEKRAETIVAEKILAMRNEGKKSYERDDDLWESQNNEVGLEMYVIRDKKGRELEFVTVSDYEDEDEDGKEFPKLNYEVWVGTIDGDAETLGYFTYYDKAIKEAIKYTEKNPIGGDKYTNYVLEQELLRQEPLSYTSWRNTLPVTWTATFNKGKYAGKKYQIHYITAYTEQEAREKLRTERGVTDEPDKLEQR